MGLRDIGARLPPGFRFYPSDEELVCHYLYKKITNEESLNGTLVDIDLHSCEPWQLPEVAKLSSNEWYFFTFRDRKYATGYRTNRATTSGYWKATGKDRPIFDPKTREIVGMRKTLVFYRNRAPNGIKTGWIMHEFRLECPPMPPKEDWVLCRVFHKIKSDINTTTTTTMFDRPAAIGSSSSPVPLLVGAPPSLPLASNNDDHHGICQQVVLPPNYSITSSNNHHPQLPPSSLNNNDLSMNDNLSSSSSMNPNHHVRHLIKDGSSSFVSFGELMNDNDDDDYGFLGDMDLLEGTSKLGGGGGGVRFDDDGSLSTFFR